MIVDEIHALCPNKRGVFLALLLERLEALNPGGFVRIGLSATQRPLDEVARYLGGPARSGPRRHEPVRAASGDDRRHRPAQGARPGVFVPFDRPGPRPAGLGLAGDRATGFSS